MMKRILRNITGKKKNLPLEALMSERKDLLILGELKKEIDRVFRGSLRIRQVDAGSCNACEWECIALTNPYYDIQRFGIDIVASPRHADILLVTGPVSKQMALALKKTYEATPEPKLVVACGDCSIDGGIYRGSYAVTDGVDKVVPVACYIKGCPPHPSDIIQGLLEFISRITEKSGVRSQELGVRV